MYNNGSRSNDLIALGIPRPAILWKITRSDGVVKRFTTHDRPLTFEGSVYLPANSLTSSARQQEAGLRHGNAELVGVIDSAEISEDDLRAGKYRNALVNEYLVDWKFPQHGAVYKNVYYIRESEWTGERWEAAVSTPVDKLTRTVGEYYSRNCRHNLGDSLCRVDLPTYTETGTVTSVVQNRLEFQSGVSAAVGHNNTGQNDNYFREGKLTWTSGSNNGQERVVARFTETNGVFKLYVPLPFDIQVGDGFSVYRGCRKKIDDCKLFHDTTQGGNPVNNIANYGGFPFVPNQDGANETPDFPE